MYASFKQAAVALVLALALIGASLATTASPALAGGTLYKHCNPIVPVPNATDPSPGELTLQHGKVTQVDHLHDSNGCYMDYRVKAIAFHIFATHTSTRYWWSALRGVRVIDCFVITANPYKPNQQRVWDFPTSLQHLSTASLPRFKMVKNGRVVWVKPKVVEIMISFYDSVYLSTAD